MGCAQRTQPLPHTCPQGIFWGVSTSLTAQGVHASNAMPSQPELGLSPVQSTRAHSRDKDGVDKVGGIEGGGCALPRAQHGVEIATVKERICLHLGNAKRDPETGKREKKKQEVRGWVPLKYFYCFMSRSNPSCPSGYQPETSRLQCRK